MDGGKVAEELAQPEHQNGGTQALRAELIEQIGEDLASEVQVAPAAALVPTATAKPALDIGPCESGAEAITKLRALKRKKVAIVGFAPSSYLLAPFQDPEWEIWSLNEAYTLPGFTRADRWFEIHIRDEIDVTQRDANHIDWLRAQKALPIYMIRRFNDIPMSVKFPIENFIKRFKTNYWTNTVSYMIALAVAEGFTTIAIYGVDMAQGSVQGGPSEYAEQRPSCEYFIGWARAKGCTVIVPPQSDLLGSIGLYGYDGDGSRFKGKARARITELNGRMNGLRQQLSVVERNRFGAFGEIQGLTQALQVLTLSPEDRAKVEGQIQLRQKQLGEWESQSAQIQVMIHQLEGAADDSLYWLRNWSPLVRLESEVAMPAAPGVAVVTQDSVAAQR